MSTRHKAHLAILASMPLESIAEILEMGDPYQDGSRPRDDYMQDARRLVELAKAKLAEIGRHG